jgi:hypothetical protein
MQRGVGGLARPSWVAYSKAKGWRLHVADIGDFPCLDSDQFTPTLAFLVGVVEFLNEVTEGEDVDWTHRAELRARRPSSRRR